MWKGGPEPQLLPPDPEDPGIPRIPGMSSKPMIPFEAVLTKSALWRSGAMFFDFFMTAPSKTPTFESIFRQSTSKKALKTYDSAADVPEKVEKTSHDNLGRM